MTDLVLLIPDKPDVERDAVAVAWEARHGSVVRIGRFWDPPAVAPGAARVYGNDTFCLVLAEKLGLTLVSPDDHLVARAPEQLLLRKVRAAKLSELAAVGLPAFVKPIVPKQFAAGVYAAADALEAATRGLGGDVEVFVSEIVTFTAEARAFVLDGSVQSCALYEGEGNFDEAARCAADVCRALPLPRTCVVDVGRLPDGRWALVELNATWGAGLNGCNASAVATCIAAASG